MVRFVVAMAFGLLVAAPAMAQPAEDCTGACEEGYLWAQENAITSPDDCAGKPSEFAAGCLAYLDDAMSGGTDEEENDTE